METKAAAKEIFLDALEASLPKNFIPKFCSVEDGVLRVKDDTYLLRNYKNIYLFGSGKAAVSMAIEMEKILGEHLYDGLVVSSYVTQELKKVGVCEGSHPFPTHKSIESTKQLVSKMRQMQEGDLFIYLLSGGSSALLEMPLEPLTLEEMQDVTELMLRNGLDIVAMNIVRKHLSAIKGGRLGAMTKAEGIVLTLSDIVGDDLYSIGSAPLYADKSSYRDALSVLDEKGLCSQMPPRVQELLRKGARGEIAETPKEPKESIKHYLLASNALALRSACESAMKMGFSVEIAPEAMEGDVSEMTHKMLAFANSSRSDVVLFGGECTVNVSGSGRGGRNQHAVALVLNELCNTKEKLTFLSAGTDGIDGNSDAAGAVVSSRDCITLDKKKLQKALSEFDTYSFFKEQNALIMTGASGTNVIDLAILIKGE